MAKFTTTYCKKCKFFSGTGCPKFGFSEAELNQNKTVSWKNPEGGWSSDQLSSKWGCPVFVRRKTAYGTDA